MINYANFLMSLDDEINTRVLLENILATVSRNKVWCGCPSTLTLQSQEIWNMYEKFEIVSGNLTSQNNLNARYNKEFPAVDPNTIFGHVRRFV